MVKRLFVLRRLLLSAGFFAGLLIFWLPAHEVFEGPKAQAFLIAAALLAALSIPLFTSPAIARPWLRPWLFGLGGLLAASLLSLAGALASLPANLMLSVEKLAPLAAAAMAALVYILEQEETRRKVLFSVCASHALLAFYGLVQTLDQNLGAPFGLHMDLIRWTSFGESRVYSTLGNPDYMAAQFTLFLPLWLGLGWRRLNVRGILKAASLVLLAMPWIVVLLVYGPQANVLAEVMKGYWAWALVSLLCFAAARNLPPRAAWLAFAYLMALLVVVAQGRGAYLGLLLGLGLMAGLAWRQGGPAFFASHRAFFLRNAMVLGTCLLGLLLLMGLSKASPGNPLTRIKPVQSLLRVADSTFGRVVLLFDSKADTNVVRRFYYKAALVMGLEHPVFGVGFGNHALFTARAQSKVWKAWETEKNPAIKLVDPHVELYTHNDFLQNFAETGLLGLAAFLAFWAFYIHKAWNLAKSGAWDSGQAGLGLGLLGLFGAFFASAMVNFPWRVLATQQLCWLAAALLAVESAPLPKEHTASSPFKPAQLALGCVLALFLALWPARWFFASCLIKQGNNGRDRQDWAAGEKYYSRAVKAGVSGTQKVELYLYLGSMYNSLRQPDKAEEWFNRAIEAYPDFIEARYNLGYTWMSRYEAGKSEAHRLKAIESFEKVLDINPRYTNALNNLGNLHYAVGDFPRAVAAYERLVLFSPQTLEARYNLGAAYLMLQRRSEAERQLEEALKINPNYAPALNLQQQLKRLPKNAVIKFN